MASPEQPWPGVPDPDAVADPGEVLAARLRRGPAVFGNCGGLALMLAIAVFFFGCCGVGLGAPVVRNFNPLNPAQWLFAALSLVGIGLGVLVAIAAALAALEAVAFWRYAGVTVELSAHPARAGQTLGVLVTPPGPTARWPWAVALVCTERSVATDPRGTKDVGVRTTLTVDTTGPDPGPADEPGDGLKRAAQVPEGAMHSFASANNSVEWAVEVTGVAFGWFPFAMRYPFVVRPAEADRTP